jgi:hypothetical protein
MLRLIQAEGSARPDGGGREAPSGRAVPDPDGAVEEDSSGRVAESATRSWTALTFPIAYFA